MSSWIVLAAIAAAAITGLLTWLLYRLNATAERGGSDGGGAHLVGDSDGDGGSGDGGGGNGGGG